MTHPKKRVLVLNDYGPDLGDQAIFAGLLAVLGHAAERYGVDLIVDQNRMDDLPFREETIATVNAHYDALLLGGGACLGHRAASTTDVPTNHAPTNHARTSHARTKSGWDFDIEEALLPSLRVPLCVYAVGFHPLCPAVADAPSAEPDPTASHVRAVVRRAAHFSVRERSALRRLQKRFSVEDTIALMPDPAMNVDALPAYVPGLAATDKAVGVCLQLDRAQVHFPPPFQPRFEHYLRVLIEALRALSEEDGYRVVLMPHRVTSLDVEVARLLTSSLKEGSVIVLPEAMPSLYDAPSLENPGVLKGVYERMTMVFGQPLHAQLLPFSVGTPVVSIGGAGGSGDPMRAVQEELGAPAHFHIDVRRFDAEVQVERLLPALREAAARREELKRQALLRRDEFVSLARRHTGEMVAQVLLRPPGHAGALAEPAATEHRAADKAVAEEDVDKKDEKPVTA